MEQEKLTKEVMNKVARFEKTRTRNWFIEFSFALLLPLVFAVVFLVSVVREVSELGTLGIAGDLVKDWDIASRFWKDTVIAIWDELPRARILVFLILLLTLAVIVFIIKRKYPVIKKRSSFFKKYLGR